MVIKTMTTKSNTTKPSKDPQAIRAGFAKHFDDNQQRRDNLQQNLQADIDTQVHYQENHWPALRDKLTKLVLPAIRHFSRKVLPRFKNALFTLLDDYKLRSPIWYSALWLTFWLRVNQIASTLILLAKMGWYYLIMLPVFFFYHACRLTIQFIVRFWLELLLVIAIAFAGYKANEQGWFDRPPPASTGNPNQTNPGNPPAPSGTNQ